MPYPGLTGIGNLQSQFHSPVPHICMHCKGNHQPPHACCQTLQGLYKPH